jgi:hypothetical protein
VAEPVVPLLVVTSGFQARVVAARLGADGIPVQLTGSVDGPYPVGTTTLWVLAADEAEARELLLIDEAEWCLRDVDTQPDADEADEAAGPDRPRPLVPLLLAVPLVGVALSSLVARVG